MTAVLFCTHCRRFVEVRAGQTWCPDCYRGTLK